MLEIIRVSGPYGYVLTLLALVVAALAGRAATLAIRGAAPAAPALRASLDALLFWGGTAAVLGFLGQCHGAYRAVGAILNASEISAAVVTEGFVISFVPTLFGLSILAAALVLWGGVTLVVRHGTPPVSALPVLVAFLLCGCSTPPQEIPTDVTQGVWVLDASPDQFLWDFGRADDALTCVVHNIRGAVELSETPCRDAALEGGRVTVAMDTGVRLEGELQLEKARIRGALHYPDGGGMDATLSWRPETDFPALAARPGSVGAYAYGEPVERDDGWPVSAAGEQGVSPQALEALVGAVDDGEAGLLHSLVVARHGRLVLEEYFHGYGPGDPHPVASCTKSVSSLLVGQAIGEGKIPGVDAPLASFFSAMDLAPNAPDAPDAPMGSGWDRLTLEHLLTMSMALDWSPEEAESLHGTGPDFFRRVLARSVSGRPGRDWAYVSANVNLLAGVIHAATGEQAEDFARRTLFEPLGFGTWDWSPMRTDGFNLMDGSLHLLPRDMARLGQLVLDQGMWREQRIVDPAWIRTSTSRHLAAGDDEDYGYLWWLRRAPMPGGETVTAVFANGWGSQFIFIFPTLDLVVVTTGGNEYNGRHMAVAEALVRYLLPGVDVS